MQEYRKLIEEELTRQHFGGEPSSLYDPIRYILQLGGKRLRPILTLLSYSLYKDDVKPAVPYAVALEAFHNFTLMHDDIMDQAPLRRGKRTVHEKWNVNTAILSGDVMLVRVYELFRSLEAGMLKEVLRVFNTCATEVCEGQHLDMLFESRKRVTVEEYISMIRFKTASLLGFSLELGAILADAPEPDRQVLREFGSNLGIAFQLKDDLLDVYADGKEFGKQQGGDILSNKKTFLLITALQLAKGKQKKELDHWISSTRANARKKVAAVKKIYDEVGVKEHAEKRMSMHSSEAFKRLAQLSVKQNTAPLIQFVESLTVRKK